MLTMRFAALIGASEHSKRRCNLKIQNRNLIMIEYFTTTN